MTIAPPPPAVSRHDIILRMYWDDETTPSVEAPIGEFFGQGWNESYPMAALPLAAGPREGRAMVSYFPMPFRSRARIEIENDTGRQIDAFYYYVDYEQFAARCPPTRRTSMPGTTTNSPRRRPTARTSGTRSGRSRRTRRAPATSSSPTSPGAGTTSA